MVRVKNPHPIIFWLIYMNTLQLYYLVIKKKVISKTFLYFHKRVMNLSGYIISSTIIF
jgi:hypothetical protein